MIAVISDAISLDVSCRVREAGSDQRLAPCYFSKSSDSIRLTFVAVILQIQDRFLVEIDPDEIPNLRCVEDLVTNVTNQLKSAASEVVTDLLP